MFRFLTHKQTRRKQWGIISLWCGILVWVCILGLFAVAAQARHGALPFPLLCLGRCVEVAIPVLILSAMITGYIGRRLDNDTKAATRQRRWAGAGFWLGCIPVLCVTAWISKEYISHLKFPSGPVVQCRSSLQALMLTMERYASADTHHMYPELSSKAGPLAIQNRDETGTDFIPQYLRNVDHLVCPIMLWPEGLPRENGHPSADVCLQNSSYLYLGYAIHDEAEMMAFAKAHKKRLGDGLPFDTDLTVDDPLGSKVIRRLRGDEKRLLWLKGYSDYSSASFRKEEGDKFRDERMEYPLEKEDSRVPVLIERLGHHHWPEGGNVIFLDGRVEYMRYSGHWPMTEKTMAILRDMEAYRPQRQESKGP